MSEFFLELFSEEIPSSLQKNLRENLLESFNKLFGEKHDITLTGLFEFNKSTTSSYSLSSIGFSNPDFSVQSVAALPDAATTSLFENTILSYAAFLDYGFDSKFFATASVRRDLASVFGQNNQFLQEVTEAYYEQTK